MVRCGNWLVIPAFSFLVACHPTKNITSYSKDIITEYKDTTIDLPLYSQKFLISSFDNDTTIKIDDSVLQVVHDSTGSKSGTVYFIRGPQTIQLDSVIKNVTIKEVYRTTVQRQVCESKFHQFTAAFFKWTISIVIFYAGMKAIFK